MSTEIKIAEWNENYTNWLLSLNDATYDDDEEEKQELDDEELSYYIKRKR